LDYSKIDEIIEPIKTELINMTHRINFIEDGVDRHDSETKIEINSIKVKLGIFDNNKVDKKD